MTENRRGQVGPYEIWGKIGRGGMAEVYHGYHPILNRHVAIKKLINEGPSIGKVELLQRFFREGKALAQLSHHNVVSVYELVAGQVDVYMVLEYVDGCDLSALLRGGALPTDVAVYIASCIAHALEHAHNHGIIHRDVKPSNIMLSKAGDVKLMDFGIARESGGSELTSTGVAMGTPMFMSPETVQGKKADARSDIYALGALLYQTLAGKAPFEGQSYELVMRKIVAGDYTKLGKIGVAVPTSLCRIVDMALAYEPTQRYQSAREMRRDLEHFCASYAGAAEFSARLALVMLERELMSAEDAQQAVGSENLAKARTFKMRRHRINPWIVVSTLLCFVVIALLLAR